MLGGSLVDLSQVQEILRQARENTDRAGAGKGLRPRRRYLIVEDYVVGEDGGGSSMGEKQHKPSSPWGWDDGSWGGGSWGQPLQFVPPPTNGTDAPRAPPPSKDFYVVVEEDATDNSSLPQTKNENPPRAPPTSKVTDASPTPLPSKVVGVEEDGGSNNVPQAGSNSNNRMHTPPPPWKKKKRKKAAGNKAIAAAIRKEEAELYKSLRKGTVRDPEY